MQILSLFIVLLLSLNSFAQAWHSQQSGTISKWSPIYTPSLSTSPLATSSLNTHNSNLIFNLLEFFHGNQQTPFGYNPNQRRCLTTGCYDANMCCPLWKLRGNCQTDPIRMQCNCRVSCGFCSVSRNFRDVNACIDENPKCHAWSQKGECVRNPKYMLANCRMSCRACLSLVELAISCR